MSDLRPAPGGRRAVSALERVRTHAYDLILSDLRMPEMDGPTFYRRMQPERPALVERIVFMTSQVDHYGQFLRDVGAPVLGKPFPRADLDAVLGRMIGPTRTRTSRPETK